VPPVHCVTEPRFAPVPISRASRCCEPCSTGSTASGPCLALGGSSGPVACCAAGSQKPALPCRFAGCRTACLAVNRWPGACAHSGGRGGRLGQKATDLAATRLRTLVITPSGSACGNHWACSAAWRPPVRVCVFDASGAAQ
jgi:hypothetical protein